jgi:hypothetical protein
MKSGGRFEIEGALCAPQNGNGHNLRLQRLNEKQIRLQIELLGFFKTQNVRAANQLNSIELVRPQALLGPRTRVRIPRATLFVPEIRFGVFEPFSD